MIKVALGIDPGLANTGFALVERIDSTLKPIHFGLISTKSHEPLPTRLLSIHCAINNLISNFHPDLLAIESLFFAKNISSALPVAAARGVILLSAAKNSLPCREFSPNIVKRALTGFGHADKTLLAHYVQILLALDKPPKPHHAADALAIASCALFPEIF